ncbi:MAG: hypothetical protein WC709_13225 [Thermoleophilia bacterium]
MKLESLICSDCGAQFDDDLFTANPSATMVCPLCGTVTLTAEPLEDRALNVHAAVLPHEHSAVVRIVRHAA